MPEVGIGSSSPAWTPEPQCGVPVHILKHHDCLLLARFCLLLSSSPSTPPLPSYFCQFFYLYFYLSFFLVALTSPDWSFFSSMQQQADESGWADSPLPPSCLPSPPLSLCRRSQQTASPRREANKSKNLSPPPPFQLPPPERFFHWWFESSAKPTRPLSEKGKC